jgi:hypothetical protein
MFDHCYEAVAIEPGAIWTKDVNVESIPRLCGDIALQLVYDQSLKIVQSRHYFDSHCWIFTPLSFLRLIEDLAKLELFPFTLKDLFPTEIGEFEFFVHLEKRGEMSAAQIKEQQLSFVKTCKEKIVSAARSAALAAGRG